MYQVWLDASTDLNHADTLERLAEAAGLTVDSTSFAAAASALTAKTLFQIPLAGSTSYENYRHYCQKILESTLGLLYADSDGVAHYHLIAEPSPSVTRTADEALADSITSEVSYADIVTQVIARNDHDWDPATAALTSDVNLVSQYLYGIKNPVELEHVLDDISNRLDVQLALRSQPTKVYEFATATKDLETDINDDFTLESSRVLDGSGSAALKVISVTKGIDKTTVQAAVIEGLP